MKWSHGIRIGVLFWNGGVASTTTCYITALSVIITIYNLEKCKIF